jgi:hypothetical protein
VGYLADRSSLRPRCFELLPVPSTADSGVEIMDIYGGATTGGGLGHYPSQELQCLSQAGGKTVLKGERRRLSVSGLREIRGQESVDNDGMNFAMIGMRQAVAAFNSSEEALGHEKALLV